MDVEERLSFDAISAHTLIAIEHRHRYAFARAACEGKRVLDLCCGVGYGSAMLAEVAASVIGVDRDAAAIDTAQATITDDHVSFVAADALAYLRTLEPGDVDVIVCFEGLEHLDDVEHVAGQLVWLVRGGAGLIASVPNSATFQEENEFHLTDFDRDSARALFADLPDAVLAYQTHAEGSLIRGHVANSLHAEINVDGDIDFEWANHFLILAGVDAERLLDPANAELQVAVSSVDHGYLRSLEQANRELWAANGRLARDRLGLGAAGGASTALRRADELDARMEELRQTRHRIGTLEAELAGAIAERDEYRRAWVAVRSSRLTNLAARVAGHRFERP